MKIPTTAATGNLRWTRSGVVWADFILEGLPYNLRPDKDKQTVRSLHQALFRALPGESLLLGLCSGMDPYAVAERMIRGVDVENVSDQWLDEVDATYETLGEIGIGRRIYWLSVPLRGNRFAEVLDTAITNVKDALVLPRSAPSPGEVKRYQHKAAKVLEAIPGAFAARPATPAQMVWLHQHSLDRGLYADDDLPRSVDSALRGPAAFSAPVLDEGGSTDPDDEDRPVMPWARKYLKVIDHGVIGDDGGPAASYQSLMVMADPPDGGMMFPGSEVLGRIDECGILVDWAMRLNVRCSDEVAGQNRRALRNLQEQYEQREGEISHAFNMLDRVSQELAEYVAVLESDKLEVEVQASIVLCVAGATSGQAQAQAKHLADFMGQIGYRFVAPVGQQKSMWWAMQPGVATSPLMRSYAQITTSKDLAALIPLASTDLGDSKGVMLGLNIAHGPLLDENLPCGPTGVALHDLEGGTKRNMSGSLAVAGELGSGKSFLMKSLATWTIDRGGRVVIADRTEMAEYAKWARALPEGAAAIVDVLEPVASLDPLRMFGPLDGSRIAQSFLIPLLGIKPAGPQGVTLAEVLDPDYMTTNGITSLAEVVQHLADPGCLLDGARDLSRMIKVYSQKRFGKVMFDDSIPPLDVNAATAIVVNTHGLALPSEQEIREQHLFEQMIPEKLFGRATFALIAMLARQICFADEVFSVFLLDEAHAVTISQEGEREIIDFLRDGRKHDAAVLLGSHDPEADFGSETLRGLIPVRIQMRQRDRTLAIKGLRWLGTGGSDDEISDDLIEMLTKQTSPITDDEMPPTHRLGEAFVRDAVGNIGRIKITGPQLAHMRDAARTDRREAAA